MLYADLSATHLMGATAWTHANFKQRPVAGDVQLARLARQWLCLNITDRAVAGLLVIMWMLQGLVALIVFL